MHYIYNTLNCFKSSLSTISTSVSIVIASPSTINMTSSSPNHFDLSDPTTIYHLSQTSKTDTRNPRHAALASQFPEQFFGKNVAASKATSPSASSQQTTPTKTTKAPSPRPTTKPRSSSTSSSDIDIFENLVHGYLSHPRKPTNPTTITEKEIKPTFHQTRRSSISSQATTATSSSISSTASTLAASKQHHPNSARTDNRKSGEIDIFEYQAAGYLSMPMNDSSQPYLRKPSASASSSSRRTSSSASSTSSLWAKAKGKLSRKGSAGSGSETEKEKEKEEKKHERERQYKELGLEEKTKFGQKGGMNVVG
ncbi:hypothetical protein D6D15_00171 [Aureobasidium pullulans]|uniref:Uncharacterized protein n=1 Tax=Aureobasidium pullulans TaxID=5580 RepID=A0A4S9BUR7_AURPU|nr:hypothetical protein D6D15_00171 [Aureobasidium pullulans]